MSTTRRTGKSLSSLLLLGLLLPACESAPLPTSPAGVASPVRSMAAAEARHPILLVHGLSFGGWVWGRMVERFKADGWTDRELHRWSYDYWQSNTRTAEEIRERVDRILAETGATQVDIVTHSMGGLSSRYYAKYLGGQDKIDAFVSIGGPNHGTYRANACFSWSCFEMRLGSAFLQDLNAGDETPGNPRYATGGLPATRSSIRTRASPSPVHAT